MKLLTNLISLVLIALGVISISYIGPELIKTKIIYPNVGDNVFVIRNETHYGTSFQTDYGRGYVVTAGHICSRSKTGLMELIVNDESENIKILSIDYKNDICILKKSNNEGLKLNKLPEIFSDIFTMGYPGFKTKQLYKGVLLAERLVHMKVSNIINKSDVDKCYIRNGNIEFTQSDLGCFNDFNLYDTTFLSKSGLSGAPTLNIYGNVIGIVTSHNEHYKGIIVDIKYLVTLINNYERNNPGLRKDR